MPEGSSILRKLVRTIFINIRFPLLLHLAVLKTKSKMYDVSICNTAKEIPHHLTESILSNQNSYSIHNKRIRSCKKMLTTARSSSLALM